MFARLVLLSLKPGSIDRTRELAEHADPVLRGLEGFRGVTFFADDSAGEYGSLTLWETRADAEAVSAVRELQVTDILGDTLKTRPRVHIYEVYDLER